MIPIHLTTRKDAQSQFRSQLALACVVYWTERCRPMLAPPHWISMQFTADEQEKPEFIPGRAYPAWMLPNHQQWRHRWAYQQSSHADFYVLTDDDILPFPKSADGRPWWEFCRDTFRAHKRLAMFQPFLFNEHTSPLGLPDLIPENAIGGLRVIRRAAVKDMLERLGDWPIQPETKGKAYDACITEALAGNDWECATTTQWWATHCGRNDSGINPDGFRAIVKP